MKQRCASWVPCFLALLSLWLAAACGSGATAPVLKDVAGDGMPHPDLPADVSPELTLDRKAADVPAEVDLPDLAGEATPEKVEPHDVPSDEELAAPLEPTPEPAPEPSPEPVDAVELDSQPEPSPELPDVQPEELVLPDLGPDLVDLAPELPPEDVPPEEVASCSPIPDPPTPPAGTMLKQADFVMVGKAKPDETFKKKNGQVVPKTNQAYVWSLATDDQRVWLGTVPNTLCLAFGPLGGIQMTYESNNAYCASMNPDPLEGWPLLFPDWRAPEIWTYDKQTGVWTERLEVKGTEQDPKIAWQTLGWRAAIVFDGYTFVAGPGTGVMWGLDDYGTSVAVFKGNEFLAAQKLADNNEARKFLDYGGFLYLGSQKYDGKGTILKWVGDESNLPDSLFQFVEVGNIPSEAAWIEAYKGRIYAITWGSGEIGGGEGFQIYRSPPVSSCTGLTEADALAWEMVFAYKDYDPDPKTNKLAGGGSMIVYRDALYFGSMHVPFQYECAEPDNLLVCALEKYLNTEAISIFRLTEDAAGAVTTQLLYGEAKGGKFGKPLIGKLGFGNTYNNYTWSMVIYDGWLYIGTMDFSKFMSDALAAFNLPEPFPGMYPVQAYGFDLWATADGNTWQSVTINGMGNEFNWGARQMWTDGESVWLGTANPFNLSPQGGWELWRGKLP